MIEESDMRKKAATKIQTIGIRGPRTWPHTLETRTNPVCNFQTGLRWVVTKGHNSGKNGMQSGKYMHRKGNSCKLPRVTKGQQ
jgi:hypothetical protein